MEIRICAPAVMAGVFVLIPLTPPLTRGTLTQCGIIRLTKFVVLEATLKRYFVGYFVRFLVALILATILATFEIWNFKGFGVVVLFQNIWLFLAISFGFSLGMVTLMMFLDFVEISIKAWKLETKIVYVYRARYDLGWNDKKIMGLGKFFENNFLAEVYAETKEEKR